MKQSTKSEKRRFHEDYKTAKEVKNNYKADLNSQAAKRINRELDDLGLPSLPSVEKEFRGLCEEIGVS